MQILFILLIAGFMIATLAVLAKGVVGMFKGADPRRSNRLMQWRIILQAAALVLFAIFMMIFRK